MCTREKHKRSDVRNLQELVASERIFEGRRPGASASSNYVQQIVHLRDRWADGTERRSRRFIVNQTSAFSNSGTPLPVASLRRHHFESQFFAGVSARRWSATTATRANTPSKFTSEQDQQALVFRATTLMSCAATFSL